MALGLVMPAKERRETSQPVVDGPGRGAVRKSQPPRIRQQHVVQNGATHRVAQEHDRVGNPVPRSSNSPISQHRPMATVRSGAIVGFSIAASMNN